MEDKKILQEAKQALSSIEDTQEVLDQYSKRLEKIISKLEYEIYSEEKLTFKDITMINEKISYEESVEKPKVVQEEVVIEKRKKRSSFNVLTFLSIIMLLLSIFTTYTNSKDMIHINDKYFILYESVNMEPTIKQNSLITTVKKEAKKNDLIAYKDQLNQMKVSLVSDVSDIEYVLSNSGRVSTIPTSQDYTVVVNDYPTFGLIYSFLMNNVVLLYLLTLTLFVLSLSITKE